MDRPAPGRPLLWEAYKASWGARSTSPSVNGVDGQKSSLAASYGQQYWHAIMNSLYHPTRSEEVKGVLPFKRPSASGRPAQRGHKEAPIRTKSGVKLGIALPQGFPEGNVDMDLIRRFAARSEALEYSDLWVSDQVIGKLPILETTTQLAYVAALTSKIRIGTSVIVSNLHQPLQLAKSLSSLDNLSGGRLTVGLGLGTTTKAYPAFGLDPEHRASRFMEGVQIMKALWTQSSVDFDGTFAQLEDISMEPKPVQRPHPPLWFGGRVPDAMRRAIRHGDGWMGAGSNTNEGFLKEHAELQGILAEEGRDPATFAVSKRVYLAIGSDDASSMAKLRTWIGAYYGNPDLADRWCIVGTAPVIAEKLSELVEAGATHLMLNPVFDEIEHLEIIAEEIAPLI
jgi:probable F420-dependent oxidoreductase